MAKASNFESRLKKAQKTWKSAKERVAESGGGYQEFEDGRYLARCVGLELGESNNGRFQAVFTWRFEEGDYEGKEKKNFQGLESEDGFLYFGRDLDRLGYELPDDLTVEAINAIGKDIKKTKPLCRIVIKTRGDFQNIYINKLLAGRGTDEEEEIEEEAEEPTEDETEETDAEETEEEADEEEADEESEDEESDEESDEDEESEESEDEEASEDEEVDDDEEEEAEDEAEEEEDEETVDLAVGMTVVAQTKAGEQQGKVIEVLAKEGMVRVKTDAGKTIKVGFDKLEVLADEPPEAPAPKKTAKKTAPAPAPAKKSAKAAPAPAKKTVKKGKK